MELVKCIKGHKHLISAYGLCQWCRKTKDSIDLAKARLTIKQMKTRMRWRKGNPPHVFGLYLCKLKKGQLTVLRIYADLETNEMRFEHQWRIASIDSLDDVKEYIGPFKDKIGDI